MRSAAFRMNEKAHAFKEDMDAYSEKLKEKRSRDAEEDWDDIDMEELDFEENTENKQSGTFMDNLNEVLDDMVEAGMAEVVSTRVEEEKVSPEVEGYLKGVENVLDAVQTQMEQIDEAENFLKSAFGDVDPSEWEDDEEEKPEE